MISHESSVNSMGVCYQDAMSALQNAQGSQRKKQWLLEVFDLMVLYWREDCHEQHREKFARLVLDGERGAAIAMLPRIGREFYALCLTDTEDTFPKDDKHVRNFDLIASVRQALVGIGLQQLVEWLKGIWTLNSNTQVDVAEPAIVFQRRSMDQRDGD